jgi:hypothetical protein
MPFAHGTFGDQLGAELQCLRGMEAAWEWYSKLSGSNTYFKDKLNTVYSNTVQEEDDTELASKQSLGDTSPGTSNPISRGMAASAAGSHAQRISDFETYFFAFVDKYLNTSDEDKAGGAISYTYDPTLLPLGEVRILNRTGRWAAIRKKMIADSKVVQKNVVSLGAISADSGNQGVVVESGVVSMDHALAGELVMVCTDDTVGATKFSVVNNLSTSLVAARSSDFGSSERQIVAENLLTIGKYWEDGKIGAGFTLALSSVVESGDGGAIFSSTTVSSPAEGDSSKGKHYFEVERVNSSTGFDFMVRWFRSGSLSLTADLVTSQGVSGTSGTQVLTLLGSSSTIQTTFDKAAAATALPSVGNKDSDIVFDIKNPRIGDVLRKTVSNDEAGNYQSKIARRWPFSLPSDVAASAEYAQSKAAAVAIT